MRVEPSHPLEPYVGGPVSYKKATAACEDWMVHRRSTPGPNVQYMAAIEGWDRMPAMTGERWMPDCYRLSWSGEGQLSHPRSYVGALQDGSFAQMTKNQRNRTGSRDSQPTPSLQHTMTSSSAQRWNAICATVAARDKLGSVLKMGELDLETLFSS